MTLADTAETTQTIDQPVADQAQEGQAPQINVGSQERLISAGAGALLALYGLKRGGLGGILMATGGAMLIQRAVTGHCRVYEALGKNTADAEGAAPEEYFEHGIQVVERFTVM